MMQGGWLAANLAGALRPEPPPAPEPAPPFVIVDATRVAPARPARASWNASGLTGEGVRRLLDQLFEA